MTVQELIDALNKVGDKELPVLDSNNDEITDVNVDEFEDADENLIDAVRLE
jgi:hypothetical protein